MRGQLLGLRQGHGRADLLLRVLSTEPFIFAVKALAILSPTWQRSTHASK